MSVSEGDTAKWSWGNGTGTGTIVQKYTQKRTLKIDGAEITRDASDDAPSFKIGQDDGSIVFKTVTEIDRA